MKKEFDEKKWDEIYKDIAKINEPNRVLFGSVIEKYEDPSHLLWKEEFLNKQKVRTVMIQSDSRDS